LQTWPTFGQLKLAIKESGVANQELIETLGFLNKIGALLVKRSKNSSLRALIIYIRDIIFGVRHATLTWRRPFNILFLAVGVARASWLVLLLVPLSLMLFAVSGLATFTRILELGLVFDVLFVTSMTLHELAHGIIIRRTTNRVVVMQAGMRIGLVHIALPQKIEVVSALAGPLAGFMLAGLVGVLFSLESEVVMAIVAFMVAITHIASFLPGYGDGDTLLAALGLKKRKAGI